MTIRAIAGLANPNKTEATIKLTMPLEMWKEIATELKNSSANGPWQIKNAIADLVSQMEKTFYPMPEPPADG